MNWQEKLAKPVQIKTGLSDIERKRIYGLGRRQATGAQQASMERMREMMGGKGFRIGESGIADTAMGTMATQGAEQLGSMAQEQALSERQRRFDEAAQTAGITTQRLAAGMQGKVGLAQAGSAAAAARIHAELGREQLEWQKEKYGTGLEWEQEQYGQEFGYRGEQSALDRMMDMYRMQYGSQESTWDRYAGMYGQGMGNYSYSPYQPR